MSARDGAQVVALGPAAGGRFHRETVLLQQDVEVEQLLIQIASGLSLLTALLLPHLEGLVVTQNLGVLGILLDHPLDVRHCRLSQVVGHIVVTAQPLSRQLVPQRLASLLLLLSSHRVRLVLVHLVVQVLLHPHVLLSFQVF